MGPATHGDAPSLVVSRPAPAKLNLGLHVLRRRPDGFHALDTVFVPLSWADRLAAAPADALTLTTSDPDLPTDGGNLVVRAAEALRQHAGRDFGARLHLDKRVPYGAGLGGGSSDAAAALRLLDDLWGLGTPERALHDLALALGSDVPFFLLGVAARATGRGEHLAPLVDAEGSRWRCPFWTVVAVPPVHVATGEAFRLVTPDDRDRPDLAAAVVSNDLARWRAEIVNDFQGPVEAAYPAIGDARRALAAAGAGYTSLSGSGSAVFGVFRDEGPAQAAAGDLAATCRVWVEPPTAL